MSDEILKDTETESNSSIPWVKEATGKTAKYISKVGKEGSGEQISYISKEDARRHQLQYEKVASAHGLVGMETYVIRVLHFLECTTLSLMGITGRHGVGKTTLLRLLHDRLIDHSSFDYVFCIESATGCTIDIIQQGMLDIVIGPHQTFDTPMAAKVISSILKGKSFLLLVDNVREPIDMFDLGLPMPLGCRQKVIITTVSNAICTRIGCAGNTILMQCLGENDAWNLFKSEARNKFVDTHPEFKRIAKQIVQECQGLPLALYTFGEALATRRDVEEWRHVCHVLEMKHPVSAEIQEVDNEKYSREYLRRMLMA